MIDTTVQDAINKQINAELYSAYLYLSMSAYFQDQNLEGCAKWMDLQAQEEYSHAKKFYDYLIERGGRVLLTAIDAPQQEWKSPRETFEAVYAHEQHVTSLIHNLLELSESRKDHATSIMLQWFVTEQVEEEANASSVLERIKMVEDSKNGMFMLDRELGQRK